MASASPRDPNFMANNPQSIIKTENGGGAGGSGQNSATPTNSNSRESPSKTPQLHLSQQQTPRPAEGHAASMEGASGVPAKIEEGIEPD